MAKLGCASATNISKHRVAGRPESPDADNLVKSLPDCMTRAGVWVDDDQVCELRVRKWRGMCPGRAVRDVVKGWPDMK